MASSYWSVAFKVLESDKASAFICYLILTSYFLSVILSILITGFLIFHIYLIYNGFTTIEFCEKKMEGNMKYRKSPFNQGPKKNFNTVFGSFPLNLLLPIDSNILS
jgi:hypothetical protein